MRRLLFALIPILAACASPRIEYQSVPAWLIPPHQPLPTVESKELQCLQPEVYERLVRRERQLRQELAECRALLGGEN
jgi:hypothetical protein